MLLLTGEKAALFAQLLATEPGCARMRFSEARIVPHNGRRYLALLLDHPEVVEVGWLFFHPDGAAEGDVAALTDRMECASWTGISRDRSGKLIIDQGDLP